MLETILYALPDLVLLLGGLSILGIYYVLHVANPKVYFAVAKFAPQYFVENAYTTLIKMIIYVLSLAWFYVSYKWFVGKERSGASYCSLGLFTIETLCLVISADNILAYNLAMIILTALIYFFIFYKQRVEYIGENFLVVGVLCCAFSVAGMLCIYVETGAISYAEIKSYFDANKVNIELYMSLAASMLPMMFVMMMFPLHFWNNELSFGTILPVYGYVSLIPVFAMFSAMFSMFHNMMGDAYVLIRPALVVLAFCTIFYGALSANREKNMRLMFSYSMMHNFGIAFLILTYLEPYAVLSSLVYLIIYILALFGICTSFYAFKSRGEYLKTLDEIGGIYQVLPYISAAVLIFTLSIIGAAPFLGFLGTFYVTNQMFMSENYVMIFLVFLSVCIIMRAYLRLIKSMYFDERKNTFDRADKGIYICLFINIILVLITLFNTYEAVDVLHNIVYKIYGEI